jgi:hypothetical protein
MEALLDGWTPPAVVVLGDESAGKSTILEQLAMLPVFPRKKRFCTRLAIHVRLRRSPDAKSVATLSVHDSHTGVKIGETTSVPIATGFKHVQDRMEEVINQHTKPTATAAPSSSSEPSGVVSDRTLVLEVQHPNVPSIDLVDLPGLTTYPESKAQEIKSLLQHQVQHNKKIGGHALYLAIVPAAGDVRPNTNSAMAFIEREGLAARTFGVFSKCDQVTDPDLLRALITGCDTSDGDSAKDMGAVALEKGWIACMVGAVQVENSVDP